MTIRFKRHFRQYKKGDICTTFADGVCRTMIERHIAEEVVEKADVTVLPPLTVGEVKVVERPPRDKMLRSAERVKGAR